ncbi:MAG: radical SAM protein [Xanthobacteraceae bacterium]
MHEKNRRFQLVLIKPSHYDDDGYVVQWLRSAIPSNSLASVYSLAIDSTERRALGEDVAIDITAVDETNTRVRVPALIDLLRRHGGFGMVGLVGVQSNQFPRALDIARPFREAGIPVVIGGFHVAGCLAMLPDMQPDLQAALDIGCSLFAGEAEGRFDQVLQDAAAGTLKPIYNFTNDLPSITGTPVPYLPARLIARTAKHYASFDAGRGCPFECSFCTIINVQGRKSRRRSPDDVERLIRQHWAEGVRRFFITDDNFARNKDWEPIFDRIAELRERDGINVHLIIQVDTLCHKIKNFVEKARRAGVTRVFIGLENINPANLQAAKKRQNKITEYRNMLLAWKRADIITYAGYILGFPADTPQSIREDIEIIKKELPIDILEFFCLTPLPGSEDHQKLWLSKVPMDPDLNKYDLEHVVTDHPKMSREEWQAIYNAAWEAYYTPAHMETILRRAAASGMGLSKLISVLFAFSSFVALEKVHPLQGGIFRLKYRTDRRPTLPVEPAWVFYPKLVWEIAAKHARAGLKWLWLDRTRRRILSDPQHKQYVDSALKFVAEEDDATLELFSHNEAARAEAARQRRVAEVIAAAR